MKNKILASVWVVIACSSFSVVAEETASKLSMGAPKAKADISKRIFADFGMYYRGPTINDLGSPEGVDNTGRLSPSGTAGMDSEANLAYLLNTERVAGVGLVVPFIAQPVTGREFKMGDAGIRYFNKTSIERGGFLARSSYTLEFPTSKGSQDREMDYAVKAGPYVRYKFIGTGLVLGSWLEAKYYAGVESEADYRLWLQPHVRYEFNDNVAFNMEYELDYRHALGRPAVELKRATSFLRPGAVFAIGKSSAVNPYVQIFPPDVATDTTSVGIAFYSRML